MDPAVCDDQCSVRWRAQNRLQVASEQFRHPGPVEVIGVEIETGLVELGREIVKADSTVCD